MNSQWRIDNWSLRKDLAWAHGYCDQSDVQDLMLMPFFSFSARWQAVTRFTWLDDNGDRSLHLYWIESSVQSGRGDVYLEAFAGLSLYLFGQRLKWQSGLQYAAIAAAASDGGRYRGCSVTSGLRAYWSFREQEKKLKFCYPTRSFFDCGKPVF